MSTLLTHNGITIDLLTKQEPKMLRDGTWAHPVRIMSRATVDELGKLVGMELWGEKVEAYLPENGKHNQHYEVVGLIMKSRKWV